MTAEEAMAKLKQAQETGDTERAHADADDVLCELLRSLGYENVVAEWEKVDKWYA
ncbi:hypothetical protein [Hyphomicrobium sp. ghe19]|uniref:hypothetical protein n=1 Tax=Hyphomicrobium sp. ghe19 TaxID=2682968 RepID=UPI001366F884|nr:hypothetical protein HYPP_01540 [Hyphomicrobium sp. ghe19]